MNRLGIENISVFGLPPVEFVNLAADLGCRYISIGLVSMDYNPHGYPRFSLREDKALRREMVAAMRERGISISLGEGFTVRPGLDVCKERAADLEVMCELGVKRINTVRWIQTSHAPSINSQHSSNWLPQPVWRSPPSSSLA